MAPAPGTNAGDGRSMAQDPAHGAGRPRRHDRDAALDAAIGLLRAEGFEAASIGELLAAMGLSRSSFYDAFGSKRELLLAALRRYSARGLEALEALAADDRRPREARLRALVETMAMMEEPRGCLLVNCMAEMAARDADVRAVLHAHNRAVEDILGPLAGGAAAARGLMAAAYGATLMRKAGTPVEVLRDDLRRLVS